MLESIFASRRLNIRVGRQFSLTSLFVATAVAAGILALVPREKLAQIAILSGTLLVPGACMAGLLCWKRRYWLAAAIGAAYIGGVIVAGYFLTPGELTPWGVVERADWVDALTGVWASPGTRGQKIAVVAVLPGLVMFAAAIARNRSFVYLHLWLATLTLFGTTVAILTQLDGGNRFFQLYPEIHLTAGEVRGGATEIVSQFLYGTFAGLLNVAFGVVAYVLKDPEPKASR